MAWLLGVIPDFFYNTSYDRYHPSKGFDRLWPEASTTDWFAVNAGSAAMNMQLSLPFKIEKEVCSLMLSVGIGFGNTGRDGHPEQIKHVGCARIMAVV